MFLWLLNLGSFFLGMTSAVALLVNMARRTNGKESMGEEGIESCLTVLICACGLGLSVLCYVAAWSV